MAETVSQVDPHLLLLDEVADFKKHSISVVNESRRELLILSELLDAPVYDCIEFSQAIVDFVRQNRHAKIRILVKDIRSIVRHGHFMLRLARRLSSKIEIRKLNFEPKNSAQAYLIGDGKRILYKHEDTVYNGFVNSNGSAECLSLIDEFNWLWDKHSEVESSLRGLLI